MNDFLMPLEERKARELRSFAKLVVYAVLIGFFFAVIVYPWGQQ